MRTITPEVIAIEHPVEFLDGQDNGFVCYIGRWFGTLGLQALEPEAEAVALLI
jgi:hypothetical protein